MARLGEDLAQGLADFRLVVDNQDPAAWRARRALRAGVGKRRADRPDRENDREDGAPSGRTVDAERSAVGFHDAEAHREPHPRADADRLGGEVGLEDARAQLRWNARPAVGDADPDSLAGRVVARSHADAARSGVILQRMLRVDDEVEQDLMEL